MSRGCGSASWRVAAVLALAFASLNSRAAEPPPPAQHIKFAAVTTNLGRDSDIPIQIDLLRFTSDEDRQALVAAVAERGIEALQPQLAGKPSLGFLWTNSSVGYLIRYAARSPLPGGGERIVIATDRPLGAYGLQPWQPAPPAEATAYPFTVLELQLDSKGAGLGTFSLAARVEVDAATSTLGLEQAPTASRLLKNVKREAR
jgi:hypothetical protein